jgi:S-adenosylmethionine:tRNA ribosyltransferase-isomerase
MSDLHPKNLEIKDFSYDLPDERIAKYPLEQRDASKLLVYQDGHILETQFCNLSNHLPQNSLLVFNNSKVVAARLLFQKATGGTIEIFALEPHEQYGDITTAMNATGSILYKCLVGGAAKWKRGMLLTREVQYDNQQINITANITERRPDCFVIELSWTPDHLAFAGILHAAGKIPIPPYLHRDADSTDAERYQTIYAKQDGSVAAPTAGLHFTDAVLQSLYAKNISASFVTLHVGAGTFMPVKAGTMQYHDMHAEFIDVDRATIKTIIETEHVIAAGTTSMRTLESLYWMGLKAFIDPAIALQNLAVTQWQVYDELQQKATDKQTALMALLNWMQARNLQRLIIKTQILIAPGYPFKIVKQLITNFHQPQSTLLLLVSAFIGNDWRRVYDYALQNNFRFLSYGDSSLLTLNNK